MESQEPPPPEYREVAGFPEYRVGNDGSVWTCRGRGGLRGRRTNVWRRRRLKRTKDGYLRATLFNQDGAKEIGVSTLVMTAFVGPCPDGMQACHENGIRDDNRPSNLRWDTPKGNLDDMVRHGTRMYGERNHKAKLTAAQVIEMRTLRATIRISFQKLAQRFGVSKHQTRLIIANRNWKHI
jgi:HNH endonuclease